ncbi:hypothetical protein ACGFOU_02345 [Streptomyces sp. NPDC048595]|uniref:hypothetical protein n=1 Tax=Streptomyces sp. NPDC048595 TaxID=3365576 RepID=UPI003718577D
MRRTTTTYASASAAVLCLGVLLTGCAGAAGEGHVAVGAAGPADGHAPVRPVPPRDGVELTPLDGHKASQAQGTRGDDGRGGDAPHTERPAPTPGSSPGPSGPSGSAAPAPPSGTHGTPPPNSPSPPGTSAPPHGSPAPRPPSPTVPAGPDAPAGLLVGKPDLADTDVRWCEKVRIEFLNTGEAPVTSGTVTFGSHVIGALGVDWATLTSSHRLPLPLAPGERRTGTWRVCVDAWRVPMGMHLDTKDVAFVWK